MAKLIKIVSSFCAIKLCFVINVLNKTIILLNLAEYPLNLANSSSAKYQAIFPAISQDNLLNIPPLIARKRTKTASRGFRARRAFPRGGNFQRARA